MINLKGRVSVRSSDLSGGRLVQASVKNVLQKPVDVFESHLTYIAAKSGDADSEVRLEEMQRQLVLAQPEDLGLIADAPEFVGFPQVVLGLSAQTDTVNDILNMLFNGSGFSINDKGLVVGMNPRDEATLIYFLNELTEWEIGFIGCPEVEIEDPSPEGIEQAKQEFDRLFRPVATPLLQLGFHYVSYLSEGGLGSSPNQRTYKSYSLDDKYSPSTIVNKYLNPETFPAGEHNGHYVSEERGVVFGIKQ